MTVEIESVDNGFIVREIGLKSEDCPRVFRVCEVDDDLNEEEGQKAECLAVVKMFYTIADTLGVRHSKHRHYNYRCIVVDHEGNEVI